MAKMDIRKMLLDCKSYTFILVYYFSFLPLKKGFICLVSHKWDFNSLAVYLGTDRDMLDL